MTENNETVTVNETPEVALDNLPAPEKPEWFERRLREIGGEIGGMPRYRVVWGQDVNHRIEAGGRMTMPYPMVRETYEKITAYDLLNTKTGRTQRLTVETAHRRFYDPDTGMMTRNTKSDQLLVPLVERYEKIIGIPHWFIERLKEPEEFGSEEAWEFVRSKEREKFGVPILPPFPKRGMYGEFLEIYELDEDGNRAYRPLDDSVLEEIKFHHERFIEAQRLSYEEKVRQSYDTAEQRREKLIDEHLDDSETNAELRRREARRVIFS